MKKDLKICFTFLMSGTAYVHVSALATTECWTESGCKDYQLDAGHYFFTYSVASAGGGVITISVGGTVIYSDHFGPGTLSFPPVSRTI
ncbi:MAG TPA: hypothetical protein VN698_16570 [Bacteroidia bacterium]|nr:hypothetical protein [Bacteroidia bacterium]